MNIKEMEEEIMLEEIQMRRDIFARMTDDDYQSWNKAKREAREMN